MKKLFLGLGTNLGNRQQNLTSAIYQLKESLSLEEMQQSAIYESKAMMLPDSPTEWDIAFLNMVISGYCQMEPIEILRIIKQIEEKFGRKSIAKWAPREIDIDILSYGNIIIESDNLTIPHPLIEERDFVLVPLQDIEANWINPKTSINISELISNIKSNNYIMQVKNG